MYGRRREGGRYGGREGGTDGRREGRREEGGRWREGERARAREGERVRESGGEKEEGLTGSGARELALSYIFEHRRIRPIYSLKFENQSGGQRQRLTESAAVAARAARRIAARGQ